VKTRLLSDLTSRYVWNEHETGWTLVNVSWIIFPFVKAFINNFETNESLRVRVFLSPTQHFHYIGLGSRVYMCSRISIIHFRTRNFISIFAMFQNLTPLWASFIQNKHSLLFSKLHFNAILRSHTYPKILLCFEEFLIVPYVLHI